MKAYRRLQVDIAEDHEVTPSTWSIADGPTLGTYFAYHDWTDGGRPNLYFDDVLCRCSAVVWGNNVSQTYADLATEWGFIS
jgi:hypothetical protein